MLPSSLCFGTVFRHVVDPKKILFPDIYHESFTTKDTKIEEYVLPFHDATTLECADNETWLWLRPYISHDVCEAEANGKWYVCGF